MRERNEHCDCRGFLLAQNRKQCKLRVYTESINWGAQLGGWLLASQSPCAMKPCFPSRKVSTRLSPVFVFFIKSWQNLNYNSLYCTQKNYVTYKLSSINLNLQHPIQPSHISKNTYKNWHKALYITRITMSKFHWNGGRVQIFGNDVNKSKFHSERN